MPADQAAMTEEVIEPALEICDPHHHLWDQWSDSPLPRDIPHHYQIAGLTALARAFPEQPMLLDHIATPILVGPYSGQEEAVFADWKAGIEELAGCPNVHILPVVLTSGHWKRAAVAS